VGATNDQAWSALREAIADNDDASAAWSQTAPEVKQRCGAYVAAAVSDVERRSRAREVATLAAAGPIQEIGAGSPEVPSHVRLGAAGLHFPPSV
jgi:hypothetical protein